MMKTLIRSAEKASLLPAPVYIHGERGTGRRALARWIHERNSTRFPNLVVWTANEIDVSGLREGDTVLLENIHEFGATQLANVRRWLDQGARAAGPRVRWIATSDLEMKDWMETSSLAADLAYRLCVVTLKMPTLQERAGDIEALAQMFLDVTCLMNDLAPKKLSAEALQALLRHNWVGHVAELMNAIERAALKAEGTSIQISDLMFLQESEAEPTSLMMAQAGMTLSEMEKKLIFQTLELTRQNKTRAAQILGISIRTLRNKLNFYREEQHA